MRQDGSIAPGQSNDTMRKVARKSAQARAGMLIDGWHAAMIAAQKNPAAKRDMGSAYIPVPYDNDAEKKALEDMLGFTVGRGAFLRDGGGTGKIKCITSGSEHPDAAWDWLYRGSRYIEDQKSALLEHHNLPGDQRMGDLVFSSQEPEWVEFRKRLLPFQAQAWNYVQATHVWPTPPSHGKVREIDDYRVQCAKSLLRLVIALMMLPWRRKWKRLARVCGRIQA